MKKFCIIFLSSIIISVTAWGFVGCFAPTTQADCGQYLRIHIRADSNDENAQAVKYRVRDKVVEFLTPIVAECGDKASAEKQIKARLSGVERCAESVLQAQGFCYGATADIRVEHFPTRVYDGYTLPEGEYTALIIQLGSGRGDNWWCVVYPPLCFTSGYGASVQYKSKIAEIIKRWGQG